MSRKTYSLTLKYLWVFLRDATAAMRIQFILNIRVCWIVFLSSVALLLNVMCIKVQKYKKLSVRDLYHSMKIDCRLLIVHSFTSALTRTILSPSSEAFRTARVHSDSNAKRWPAVAYNIQLPFDVITWRHQLAVAMGYRVVAGHASSGRIQHQKHITYTYSKRNRESIVLHHGD